MSEEVKIKPKKARTPKAPPKNVPPYLFVGIVERNRHGALTEALYRNGVFFTSVVMGQGTASSEVMDILGLEDSAKDIVISVTTASAARGVMGALNDRLAASIGGKGIAFIAPLSAAPNLLVTAMAVKTKSTKENKKMSDDKFSLILISVNQGYADEVMSVAKKAGARGGTLIRARQTVNEEAEGMFAADFTEREIIAIITPKDNRAAIMDAVNSEHGVREKAGAVVLALPVEDIAKLS